MPRVESLTGLRWFAALAVFLFHVGQRLRLPGLNPWFSFGDAGVSFFYVLSGFVLTWSFAPKVGKLTFYWRRFARVWPMLAVSTILAWFAFAESATAWRQTLLSLTLVEAWTRPQTAWAANPVGWSISCEAFFYLVFPFLVRRVLRARIPLLLAVGAALLTIEWGYWYVVRDHIDPAHFWVQLSWFIRFPPYRLVEFVLGMLAASALRQGWRPRINMWLALALVPLTAVVLNYGAAARWWQPLWSEQAFTPAFVLVVLAAAKRDLDGRPSFLRSRPMVALGAWSYTFYLVHLSVLFWITTHVPIGTGGRAHARIAILVLAVATLLSWAGYRWVEHPVEKRLRALLPPRRGRQTGRPSPAGPAAVPPALGLPGELAPATDAPTLR